MGRVAELSDVTEPRRTLGAAAGGSGDTLSTRKRERANDQISLLEHLKSEQTRQEEAHRFRCSTPPSDRGDEDFQEPDNKAENTQRMGAE